MWVVITIDNEYDLPEAYGPFSSFEQADTWRRSEAKSNPPAEEWAICLVQDPFEMRGM